MRSYLKSGVISIAIYAVFSIIIFAIIKIILLPELIYQMEKSPLTAIIYAVFIVMVIIKSIVVLAVRYTSVLLDGYSFPMVKCMFPFFLDFELGYLHSEAMGSDIFEGYSAYIDSESSFHEKLIDFGVATKDLISLSFGYVAFILNVAMWTFAVIAFVVLKAKVGFYSLWPAHQICMIIFFVLFMMNMIARSYINSAIIRESEMPSVSAFWATFPIIIPIGSGILYFVIGSIFKIGASSLYNFLLLVSVIIIPISMLVYSKMVFNDKVYEDQEDIRNFEL